MGLEGASHYVTAAFMACRRQEARLNCTELKNSILAIA